MHGDEVCMADEDTVIHAEDRVVILWVIYHALAKSRNFSKWRLLRPRSLL